MLQLIPRLSGLFSLNGRQSGVPEGDLVPECFVNQKGFSDAASAINSNKLRLISSISSKQLFLLFLTTYHAKTPL